MSMRRRNRMGTDHVEPDLPITPMLDMSFQLLSFFIMTFKPTPTEAQIAMALPPPQEGGPSSSIPDITSDKPTKFIVHVTAIDSGDDLGKIKGMTIREEGSALEAKDIGPSIESYMKELKSRFEQQKGKPTKLTLEIDDKLTEAYVVQLLDHGIRAGFTDISPVPTDSRKR
jgi:biopolymer transport protein ExbD